MRRKSTLQISHLRPRLVAATVRKYVINTCGRVIIHINMSSAQGYMDPGVHSKPRATWILVYVPLSFNTPKTNHL